ncbi:MAG: adenylosuccinate synthase [Candidatus Thorarchaeota archaeon]
MKSPQSLVVVGLQWGDEGKGKIVDFLSENFDIVARFQGGSNAGHTVMVADNTHKFRIIPTGAVRGKKVVIGNGVVVDPIVLIEEIKALQLANIDVDLLISDRAHLITPFQIQIDGLNENAKGIQKLGTTKRGIGPTYSDKVARLGIRFCDFTRLNNEQWLVLESASKSIIEKVYETEVEDPSITSLESFSSVVEKLLPYVGNSGEYLESALDSGKRVLFEGAQGTLLDIDHGTYPFVTSSNCVSAAASIGTGLSFSRLDSVLGVCKAYMTRVGTGPFPTELKEAIGRKLQSRGKEFGTVTGRPRRCGWLDLVALKYAIHLNGCSHLALTKIDVLSGINPLRVCVAYDINGSETKTFPACADTLSEASPIYEELDGWSEEIGISSESYDLDNLPVQLQNYLSFIESSTGSKVALLSVGPKRTDTIVDSTIRF